LRQVQTETCYVGRKADRHEKGEERNERGMLRLWHSAFPLY